MVFTCLLIMFFILTLFFITIILSSIEIFIKDLNISTKRGENIFKIQLKLKVLNTIPILKFTIDSNLLKKEKMKESIKKIESKVIEEKFNFIKIENLKNLKLDLKNLDLKVLIGIEDASINAIFVGTISIIISMLLGFIANENNNCNWKVIPIYQNTNLIKINLTCIFSLKIMHIINTIIILKKKGEKNVRTSDRKAYIYGNE